MSKPRFLCDENTDPALVAAMRQAEPAIDVLRVGDAGAPRLGTKDSDLLLAAETLGRVLVTMDRRSMPGHLFNHFSAGRHSAGVYDAPARFDIRAVCCGDGETLEPDGS